jgi:hypothetical protein
MEFKKQTEDNLNVIFFALGVLMVVLINNTKIDLSLFYVIPLGLLAFIGIFYPLVFKRELFEKRNRLAKSLWKLKYAKVKKIMIDIDKIFKKSNIENIDKIREKLGLISDEIEIFSDESLKINVEYHVKRAIIYSFITIIISVYATILPNPFYFGNSNFSLNSILSILLLLTIYYNIRFLLSWNRIQILK